MTVPNAPLWDLCRVRLTQLTWQGVDEKDVKLTFTSPVEVVYVSGDSVVLTQAWPVVRWINGQLCNEAGDPWVDLPATQDPDISPTDFTITLTVQLPRRKPVRYTFKTPPGGDIDLSQYAVVSVSDGVIITKGDKGDPGPPFAPAAIVPSYSVLISDIAPTLTPSDAGLGFLINGDFVDGEAVEPDEGMVYFWDGEAFEPQEQGSRFEGQEGRGIADILVDGANLTFVMTKGGNIVRAIPALANAISAAQAAQSAAETAADNAAASENAAGVSEANAAASESNAAAAAIAAGTSETNSAASEAAADASATAAAQSAVDAQASADSITGAVTDAQAARDASIAAKDDAETARTGAEAAETGALAAQAAAEAARDEAEDISNVGPATDTNLGLIRLDGVAGGEIEPSPGDGQARVVGWDSKADAADLDDKVDKTTSVDGVNGIDVDGDLATGVTITPIYGTSSGTVAEGDHGHPAADITDSGSVGRNVLAAATGSAARSAMGAEGVISASTDPNDVWRGDKTWSTVSDLKADMGLDAVDNTADEDKPISNAAAVELSKKLDQSAVPYDIAYIHSLGERETGFGDVPDGIILDRDVTFDRATYLAGTDDGTPGTTVRLVRNGTPVSGSSGDAEETPTPVTGSFTFDAGDRLQVEVTAVGVTPGERLTVMLRGLADVTEEE